MNSAMKTGLVASIASMVASRWLSIWRPNQVVYAAGKSGGLSEVPNHAQGEIEASAQYELDPPTHGFTGGLSLSERYVKAGLVLHGHFRLRDAPTEQYCAAWAKRSVEEVGTFGPSVQGRRLYAVDDQMEVPVLVHVCKLVEQAQVVAPWVSVIRLRPLDRCDDPGSHSPKLLRAIADELLRGADNDIGGVIRRLLPIGENELAGEMVKRRARVVETIPDDWPERLRRLVWIFDEPFDPPSFGIALDTNSLRLLLSKVVYRRVQFFQMYPGALKLEPWAIEGAAHGT
jgi:hypothetical protein